MLFRSAVPLQVPPELSYKHRSGSYLLASHCGCPGLIPGQSIWDLRRTKCHRDRCFSENCSFQYHSTNALNLWGHPHVFISSTQSSVSHRNSTFSTNGPFILHTFISTSDSTSRRHVKEKQNRLPGHNVLWTAAQHCPTGADNCSNFRWSTAGV
jgi:hypothetical protein